MWERYQTGTPLYRLNVTAPERAALRARLTRAVQVGGIRGLVADGAVARDFLCFASLWTTEDARKLRWPPLLRELDVPETDLASYPELYDPIEAAFRGLGRDVVTTLHGRRFLASFLRDGGLPTSIGNLADLIIAAVEDVGWGALRDAAVRELVTEHVARRATGPAATLLSGVEGRSALEDLLATAADARARLLDQDIDPLSLRTGEEVRSALLRANIPLPSVRNLELLIAVLRSFTHEPASPRAILPPLRLVVRVRGSELQLLVHLDLEALGSADIPEGVTHLSVKAEPCPREGRKQVRYIRGRYTSPTDETFLRWSRSGAPSATHVAANYAGHGGILQVTPVGALEWEETSELWFDDQGEMLAETRTRLQPGESFVVLSWREVELVGEGGVAVQRLLAPAGARGGWVVEATGTGQLRIVNGPDEETTLTCGPSALDVAIRQSGAISGVPRRFVRALPDLSLPDGVVAVVEVSLGSTSEVQVRLSHAAGLVRLSSHPLLRSATGRISVRVSTEDGRSWGAIWNVLPTGFALRPFPGGVDLEHAGRVAHVVGAETQRLPDGRYRLLAHEGRTSVLAFLEVGAGAPLRLPLETGPRTLRLWADRGLTRILPLDPRPELTELMVYDGACLEIAGAPGSTVTIRSGVGDALITVRKRSSQRVFLPLSDLSALLWRRNEPRGRFQASIDGSVEVVEFGVHIPRLSQPRAQGQEDGSINLEFPLDARDLPTLPALAFFPVTPPLGAPAFVPTALSTDGATFRASLTPTNTPTQRGQYIAFLVDKVDEPARPMSYGRRFSVPLAVDRDPPLPERLNELEQSLWTHDERALDLAITNLAGSATFEAFADAFIHATKLRHPYRLGAFWLWSFAGTRALWLIFTCAARLPPEEQGAWFHIWVRQIRDFSWLHLTRRDVQLLGSTLPRRSIEDRIGLLERAKAACPMLRSTEHFLFSGLASGRSLPPLVATKRYEVNAPEGCDILKSSGIFSLPMHGAAQSWLRGMDLDPDLEAAVEEGLTGQVMRGARARAIRDLFRLKVTPPTHLELRPPAGDPWGEQVGAWVDAEWAPLAALSLCGHIRDLDRECAFAAMLVARHRMNRARPRTHEFQHILKLEQLAPDLLDAWVTAVTLRDEART